MDRGRKWQLFKVSEASFIDFEEISSIHLHLVSFCISVNQETMAVRMGVRRTALADVCPGLEDTLIVGIIIASQSSKIITMKKAGLPLTKIFVWLVDLSAYFLCLCFSVRRVTKRCVEFHIPRLRAGFCQRHCLGVACLRRRLHRVISCWRRW